MQKEKAVVSIVKVFKKAYPDSTTDDQESKCVDIKAIEQLKTAVTLDVVKTDPHFAEMSLVKIRACPSSPSKQKNGKLFAH